MKIGVLIMSILAFLMGCNSIKGDQYQELSPKFSLEEFFSGNIKAWGIIQDYSQHITARFEADMVGTWSGNKGVLDEVFTYYDSDRKQVRKWEITKIDDLNYTGTAGDIIGTATGKSFGNAINWTYEMDVPVEDKTYRLKFDDWMWAMDDGNVVINRSYLKKFGITVAEITIFMQKQ
jgi:hypothetical protein